MKGTLIKLVGVLVVLTMLGASLAACGPTPEPQVVVETVEVEKTVVETVEVEKEVQVEVTTVVQEEVEVEKVVTATPEPVEKIATFIWTQEPDSLNPYYTNMWFSAILQQLYNCWAWEYDAENTPFPKLVTEIPSMDNGGVSEDGLTITLNLRDDLVWSDGTPLTAEDFVFTWQMIMDPGNTVYQQYPYDYLDSVEAPDAQTVVMNFAEPFAPWQANFWKGIMPKHVLEPVFEAEGTIDTAEWTQLPDVSCGPFMVTEWESGSYIQFARNDNYWEGQANLDQIFLQFVPDDATQTAALVAGDGDIGTFPPLSDVPVLEAAGVDIIVRNGGYGEGWYFNMRDMASPGAKDPVVRQAVAMAIDRQAIADDLLLGLAPVAHTFWHALPTYEAPDLEPFPYDPEGAKAMLEEAGYVDSDGDGIREDADGNPLTLIHGTTIREIRQDIQAVTQQMLREVGINLETLSYDSDIFFGSYADGAPPAVGEVDIMEWSDSTSFPDPDTSYWLCSELPDDENPWGANYFGCDEYLDELFQRQLVTLNDQERKEIFWEISKYVHDQAYFIGIYVDADYWMVGERLTGVDMSGVTPFFNIIEWDIE